MPATSPEAIARKKNNLSYRKDELREVKIESLGGRRIPMVHNVPLDLESRSERIEVLRDLLYPKRHDGRYGKATLVTHCIECNTELPKDGHGKLQTCSAACRKVRANRASREHYFNKRDGSVANHGKFCSEHERAMRYKVASITTSALKRGITVEITWKDLSDIWTGHCAASGADLSDPEHVPSVDRIDSSLGYTVGNVQWITNRLNTVKRDATLDELKVLVAYMERYG